MQQILNYTIYLSNNPLIATKIAVLTIVALWVLSYFFKIYKDTGAIKELIKNRKSSKNDHENQV